MPMNGDEVVCAGCGRRYRVSPMDDFYIPRYPDSSPAYFGFCEPCLMKAMGVTKVVVVNPEVGEQLQREHEERMKEEADEDHDH